FDAANAVDPTTSTKAGRKSRFHAERRATCSARYQPDAAEVATGRTRPAHRALEGARSDHPMHRGYLAWRSGSCATRGVRARSCAKSAVARRRLRPSRRLVGKARVSRVNPDTQLVEDVAALVFIEHYDTLPLPAASRVR
ncbi:MAG: DUF4202 family protein, partial [Rhodocyclaceae bacterium]|nr:DUF4202 family protein [Rhodocyclaceae bacterium]